MTNQSSADLRLGQCLHRALKEYVRMESDDAAVTFSNIWVRYRSWNLLYADGEDWSLLHYIGTTLAQNFADEYIKRAIVPLLNENKLTDCSGKIEQPDLICNDEHGLLVVDFKFGRAWTQQMTDEEVQLTRYAKIVSDALNEPPPIRVAICNLVKATQPRVEWLFSFRTQEQIDSCTMRTRRSGAVQPGGHCTTDQPLISLREFAGGVF